MVTTQMKTDAQRLGNGKKAFDVKQVEKMIESAGGSYTAGTGIDITDDEISVDTTAIQEKLTAGTGIDITENVISASSSGYTLYNSTTWSDIFKKDSNDAWYVTKDCVIVARDNQNFNYTINLFKGIIYANSLTIPSINYAQSGNYVDNSNMLMLLYNINFDNASIGVVTQTLQINSNGSTGVQSNQTFVKDISISGYIGSNHIRLFVKD